MKIHKFIQGEAIHGSFGSLKVQNYLQSLPKFPLIIADPPYGNILPETWDRILTNNLVDHLLDWTKLSEKILVHGGSLYLWGCIGKPHDRPFFSFLSRVEEETLMTMRNLISWGKKRGYGQKDNYLFTREECAWLIKGERPSIFHIPLLSELRGYPGYNKQYPAKSPYKRRTSIWTDITEIFKGKLHVAHKPEKLAEIMISTHTNEGDYVLDPFAGSGSTAVAAINLKRKFIVIEKDPNIFDKMVARLTKLNA